MVFRLSQKTVDNSDSFHHRLWKFFVNIMNIFRLHVSEVATCASCSHCISTLQFLRGRFTHITLGLGFIFGILHFRPHIFRGAFVQRPRFSTSTLTACFGFTLWGQNRNMTGQSFCIEQNIGILQFFIHDIVNRFDIQIFLLLSIRQLFKFRGIVNVPVRGSCVLVLLSVSNEMSIFLLLSQIQSLGPTNCVRVWSNLVLLQSCVSFVVCNSLSVLFGISVDHGTRNMQKCESVSLTQLNVNNLF